MSTFLSLAELTLKGKPIESKGVKFSALTEGTLYMVTECKKVMTGFGPKFKLTMCSDSDPDTDIEVWPPESIAKAFRLNGIRWKFRFYIHYKGFEKKALKGKDGAYADYQYDLFQVQEDTHSCVAAQPTESTAETTEGDVKTKAKDGAKPIKK